MNISKTVRRIATAAAALAVAVPVLAQPAQASTSNLNGTLTATAGCDFGYHTMHLMGSFRLSSRFPKGTWISTRYANWFVNPTTGVRTSAVAYSVWQNSWAGPGTVYWSTALEEGYAASPTNLPGVSAANLKGALRASVQVGVWNGAWELTGWDSPQRYINTYKNQPFENATSCFAS